MSEQALKAAPSGARSVSDLAKTGSYSVVSPGAAMAGSIAPGNDRLATGKELPGDAIELPDLENLAAELNTVNRNIGRDLRFQVDLDRGNAVLQVLDSETGEIIRQIPKEKAAVDVAENGAIQIRLFDDVV